MAYDADRAAPATASVQVYNPWGYNVTPNAYHVSPFPSTVSTVLSNADLLPVYHTPTVPNWVSSHFAKLGTAKATASAANTSVAAQMEAYSSAPITGKAFFAITPGKTIAISNNNTSSSVSVQDDRVGIYELSGNELSAAGNTLMVFVGQKAGQTTQLTKTQLDQFRDAIVAATDAAQLRTAVSTAQASAEVRFGIKLPDTTAVDIAGDATPEKGIIVGLGAPTSSTGTTLTFGLAKDSGEVSQAKVANGAALQLRNTPLAAEERIVSIDSDTNTVLFVDGKDGHWQVGEKGKPADTYIYLTIDGSSTSGASPIRLNDDSLEVTALHARAIGGAATGWVAADLDGFEVTVQSNEFEDQFYTLYFNATGQLVGSEYLSDEELIDVEQEADIDINDNGGLGDVDFFLAEGLEGAPDLYVNAANDLVLISQASTPIVRTPLTADGQPVSYWDLDEGDRIALVVPDSSAAAGVKQYLLVVEFVDGGLGTVRVLPDGALELDGDGEVVVNLLDENEIAAISERAGIDVTGDGEVDDLSEVVGDAGDNIFDMHERSGDLLFVDTPGDDIYSAGSGDDVLLGLLPDDSEFAARGDNRFIGGEGDDLYAGFTTGDAFFGGPGSDTAIVDRIDQLHLETRHPAASRHREGARSNCDVRLCHGGQGVRRSGATVERRDA